MNLELSEFIVKAFFSFKAQNSVEEMWKPPIMAAVSADHPRIPSLKQAVSSDHLLPEELLTEAKSIVVFFVPFDKRIIDSNLKGESASKEWAQAYVLTKELTGFICEQAGIFLNMHGFRAAAITPAQNFDEVNLTSVWSQRHIAWIAGLGSLGINNMLITPAGCCGRVGSFVTDADCQQLGIPAMVSGNNPPPEKCLNKINGSCGVCVKKCFAGAYKKDGSFDRHKCYEVCLKNAELYKDIGHVDACGKCLVGLPCSEREPLLC